MEEYSHEYHFLKANPSQFYTCVTGYGVDFEAEKQRLRDIGTHREIDNVY